LERKKLIVAKICQNCIFPNLREQYGDNAGLDPGTSTKSFILLASAIVEQHNHHGDDDSGDKDKTPKCHI